MRNRTRNKAVTIRMTEQELRYFKKNMETAKIKSQADFILAVLQKKPIIVIADFQQLLTELKRQGTNLNQISRRLNECGEFGEAAGKVMNECWAAYRHLKKLGDEISNAAVQGEGVQVKTE